MAAASETGPEAESFAFPLDIAPILGLRTAELHAAFATPTEDPAFTIAPLRKSDLKAWAASVSRELRHGLVLLRAQLKTAPETLAKDIRTLLAAKDKLLARLGAIEGLAPSGGRSRIHGDYHLGQILIAQDDVMIVDFEGEPQRGFDERRRKSAPLRDVASMIRSFDYLAWAALDRRRGVTGEVGEAETERALQWRDGATRDFLEAYFGRASETPTHPEDAATARGLLELFTIQKVVYEIGYEAANRPAWLSIPVRGMVDLLNRSTLFQ